MMLYCNGMDIILSSESEVHPAASASQNQLTDAERFNLLSLTSLRKKDEIWHNLEAVNVEPGADHVTYATSSIDESHVIEMKEIFPIPITFPVIKAEIQEDEMWNFTAAREVQSEVEYGENVYSLEELGVLEAGVQLNTHTRKEYDDKLGAESCSAECLSIGQEPHHSHPAEGPLNIDAVNNCMSDKVSPGPQSVVHGRKEPDSCQSDTELCSSTHSALQQHHNHNGQETYKCKICSETFFEKETLAVHVLVHSGTLSFSSWSKAIRM
jgi:hypothetical protein